MPADHALRQAAATAAFEAGEAAALDAVAARGTLVRGAGSYLWDDRDRKYLDLMTNYGVNLLGHAHPGVTAAIQAQAAKLTNAHQSFYTPARRDFIEALGALLPRELNRISFGNSGAEAVEAAIKYARVATGRTGIIAAQRAYHGRTFGALAATADAKYRDPFKPMLEGVRHVPFDNLDAIEQLMDASIAAVIIEPIQGEGGIRVPPDSFLPGLRALCDRHGALLIFDEVKTGVTIAPGGATERFHVTPDLIALAKAIGGGLPCGAVGGREDVMGTIEEKRVAQMGTFNGNPLTMAASKVTLLEILDPNAYAHFDALAETLQGGLDEAIQRHGLPYHVITLAARGGVTYRARRVRNYRDYLEIDKSLPYLSWLYQCNRGVLMAPGAEENWTLSVQHSIDDVQRYVDNFTQMARDLRS